MGYQQVNALTYDSLFQGRIAACCTEQANVFKDDGRLQFKAFAEDVLKGQAAGLMTMYSMSAAAPGFADTAATADGKVDQSLIQDADILAAVQAIWPTVAGLFYNEDGTRA